MDVITHVTDLIKFREECKALAGQVDVDGNLLVPDLAYDAEKDEIIYGVTKVPVLYKSGEPIESITLIRRDSDDDLRHFEYMVRLGECINNEYVFDSPEAQAEYERVYQPFEVTEVEIDGAVTQVSKPYMIGVFA